VDNKPSSQILNPNPRTGIIDIRTFFKSNPPKPPFRLFQAGIHLALWEPYRRSYYEKKYFRPFCDGLGIYSFSFEFEIATIKDKPT
jgi:hypothetical protein